MTAYDLFIAYARRQIATATTLAESRRRGLRGLLNLITGRAA